MSWVWPLELTEPAIWVVGALVAGATVGFVGGRRASPPDAAPTEELLNALERALRGEPREAFEVLRREANEANASPALYFALAAALRRMGQTERSAQVHRGLLARGKTLDRADRVRAQLGLAVDYLSLGRPSLADDLLKQLPRSVRKHPNLLRVRRKTALEAHDWQEAIESTSLMVRRGEQDKSEMADVYAKMGAESLEHDDAKNAAKSFKKALKRDGGNMRALHGLAEICRRDGKMSRARKYTMSILRQNPSLAPLLLKFLRSTFDLSAPKDRERYVSTLEELAMDEAAALWIGLEEAEILFQSENHESCGKLLETLIDRYPKAFEAHAAYVDFLIDTHREDDALRHVQRLLDLASAGIHRFQCTQCNHISAHGFMDCPSCGRYGHVHYVAG